MLDVIPDVEQDSVVEGEGDDPEVLAEALGGELSPVEVELGEDVRVEDVSAVVGSALGVICDVLVIEPVVVLEVAELGGWLEAIEEEEEELVEEGVSSVTVWVVTIVTGAVAVTVVIGASGATTEMSVLVTVVVLSFEVVAVTVTSGISVGDEVTVCTTVVVVPSSVVAGLPPSMRTIE